MHTKITAAQFLITQVVLLGQLVVAILAWNKRYRALAIYLGSSFLNTAVLQAFSLLTPVNVYFLAYCVGTVLDYLIQTGFVIAIFAATRRTGLPTKYDIAILQSFAFVTLAIAITTMPFALINVANPAWKWFLVGNHIIFYWLCLLLACAPVYAWIVDSAKDPRIFLAFIGMALYIVVRAGAFDFMIATHLATHSRHFPDFAYLLSLIFWFSACLKPSAYTEELRQTIREKRNYIVQISKIERVRRS